MVVNVVLSGCNSLSLNLSEIKTIPMNQEKTRVRSILSNKSFKRSCVCDHRMVHASTERRWRIWKRPSQNGSCCNLPAKLRSSQQLFLARTLCRLGDYCIISNKQSNGYSWFITSMNNACMYTLKRFAHHFISTRGIVDFFFFFCIRNFCV